MSNNLQPGQVYRDCEGDILRLNRSVPGDASAWYCDVWSGWGSEIDCWLAEDCRVEPSDLIERLPERESA